MRFMVIVKATKDSENESAPPDPQLMADMNKFNDEEIQKEKNFRAQMAARAAKK